MEGLIADKESWQLIIAIITILGSGFSVYVGVKVALAEVKNDIKWHGKQLEDLGERVDRLEQHYFK